MSQILRKIITTFAGVALVFGMPAPTSAARVVPRDPTGSPPFAAPAACSVTVGAETSVLDGEANLSGMGPGSVICLQAGTRGNVKVANLHGTPAAPITIRNEGGSVLITGTQFEAAIYVQASSNLRITGSGSEARCGAEYTAAEQRCGIEIDGATKGIKVATSRGDASELEFDHVAIHRVSSDKETRGIAIHPVDRQLISGIRIHHNYVSNTLAEAIYIGSEPRDTPLEQLGKVERVEIAYNRLEQIAWDGIKLKVSIGGSSIHHNVITNTGLAGYAKHESGITVAMSKADVHDNRITGSVEGIKSGRALDDSGNRYYNNVVVDVETLAIETAEARARIFHNTIVGSEGIGIRARGDLSIVSDNIIADVDEAIIARGQSVQRNNLVGTSAEMEFVDARRGDFSLRASSPAVDAGRSANPAGCDGRGVRMVRPAQRRADADHNGVSRPRGCRADIGAFEFVPRPRTASAP